MSLKTNTVFMDFPQSQTELMIQGLTNILLSLLEQMQMAISIKQRKFMRVADSLLASIMMCFLHDVHFLDIKYHER